jgi:hypothetical protein
MIIGVFASVLFITHLIFRQMVQPVCDRYFHGLCSCSADKKQNHQSTLVSCDLQPSFDAHFCNSSRMSDVNDEEISSALIAAAAVAGQESNDSTS